MKINGKIYHLKENIKEKSIVLSALLISILLINLYVGESEKAYNQCLAENGNACHELLK